MLVCLSATISACSNHKQCARCPAGDILHVCKNSNECRVPQWFSHLQWLDLSHNPQLQLLGGDELDLLHLLDFLDVCQQLQGLCLQHTGGCRNLTNNDVSMHGDDMH